MTEAEKELKALKMELESVEEMIAEWWREPAEIWALQEEVTKITRMMIELKEKKGE